MFESIILGAVQGIAEWLPISSEAMVVLVQNNFFPSGMVFSEMISFAIFLHLGTLLSVVIYFRSRVWGLIRNLFNYRSIEKTQQQEISFIILATLVSGAIGFVLLELVERYQSWFSNEIRINIIVAVFLGVTALLLYGNEKRGENKTTTLNSRRSIGTGIFQGFAAIPGISRSGATIAGMGLLGIDKERALELSFLLSIPLILGANIFLNLELMKSFSFHHLLALTSAFVFGMMTIHLLLKLVRRIRFSYFVGIFAMLLILLSILS